IKFVLMELNKKDFIPVVEFAKSIGATCQLISCISPSKNGNCGLATLNVKNDYELKNVLQYWNSISDYNPNKGIVDYDAPICEAGRNSISIDPYGNVTPCNAFPYIIGNLRKDSIKNIWQNSAKLKEWQNTTIKNLKKCKGCKYTGYCSFCPGNALKYTGNMFGKVKETCRQARLNYEINMEKKE
ncbi:MAG: SPASM domain-containing protein, partial [Clostridia bacterium]|nr:SPASM domain-containing protein [Clostridia bacterium]